MYDRDRDRDERHGAAVVPWQASKGVLGIAVLGLAAACSADDDDKTDVASSPGRSGSTAGLDWWRVDFAYVSAYVLVRGREAAIVDCGFGSRVDEIGAVLAAAGTGWIACATS